MDLEQSTIVELFIPVIQRYCKGVTNVSKYTVILHSFSYAPKAKVHKDSQKQTYFPHTLKELILDRAIL